MKKKQIITFKKDNKKFVSLKEIREELYLDVNNIDRINYFTDVSNAGDLFSEEEFDNSTKTLIIERIWEESSWEAYSKDPTDLRNSIKITLEKAGWVITEELSNI